MRCSAANTNTVPQVPVFECVLTCTELPQTASTPTTLRLGVICLSLLERNSLCLLQRMSNLHRCPVPKGKARRCVICSRLALFLSPQGIKDLPSLFLVSSFFFFFFFFRVKQSNCHAVTYPHVTILGLEATLEEAGFALANTHSAAPWCCCQHHSSSGHDNLVGDTCGPPAGPQFSFLPVQTLQGRSDNSSHWLLPSTWETGVELLV